MALRIMQEEMVSICVTLNPERMFGVLVGCNLLQEIPFKPPEVFPHSPFELFQQSFLYLLHSQSNALLKLYLTVS